MNEGSSSPPPVNPDQQSPAGSPCDEQLEQTWDEIHLMVSYAKEEGEAIPTSICERVANLCYPEKAQDQIAPVSETAMMRSRLAEALQVHGALLQLIAPVTPLTIRASANKGNFWGSNLAVNVLLVMSIISLVVFLVTAIIKESWADSPQSAVMGVNAVTTNSATGSTNSSPAVPAPTPPKGSRLPPGWIEIAMLLAAASLGAGFYGLYTAHKYIVNRTFDPKYTRIYIVRYVLGLTSGSILGYFGASLLNGFAAAHNADPKQLGPPVLALIGGYAAEAVSQILQRIADTLVTIVRGTNDDAIDAKKSELEVQNKQQDAQRKLELLKPLQAAKEALLSEGVAPQSSAHTAIQKAIDSLTKQ